MGPSDLDLAPETLRELDKLGERLRAVAPGVAVEVPRGLFNRISDAVDKKLGTTEKILEIRKRERRGGGAGIILPGPHTPDVG